ncbi:hypothetical protein [Lactobacillus delbrueckii]|uniref:hypothetical protein n=1 Tax=Lactobacillus delbrueckii TaxID=1584 RepID=UPI001E418FE6|nr:hypothetical protein [Lactobacillus delbrueckii]MCD5545465.1 hypothetical protein [Lactobacillus delbrueckii subsp. lactis]
MNIDFKKELKRIREQQTRLEAKQEVLLDIMAEFWPKVAKEGTDFTGVPKGTPVKGGYDLAEAQLKAIKEDQGDQATQLNNLLDSLKEAVLDEGISPNNIVTTGNGLIIDDISDS